MNTESKLFNEFLKAPESEKTALFEYIRSQVATNSTGVSAEIYTMLKTLENEKQEAANKQAEIQRGYQLREESAKKFQAKFGQL